MPRVIVPLVLSLLLLCANTPRAFGQGAAKTKPITIAQFGHVFLYMPLYVAVKKGYFKEQGLDVRLVSTGGDEKTFTAVITGNAQFGVSDPTFTAIARERGQGGKVVAGIVRGVPFWVVTFKNDINKITSPEQFKGRRIATYTAPSTSFAVMKKVLQNNGKPVDAKIIQGAFGTLLALLKANHADMALDIEPIVSIAINEGAHIVYSPAKVLGDFAFTGLTVSDDYLKKNSDDVQKAVNAINKAMIYIHKDFEGAVKVACAEFPEVKEPVVRAALRRLADEGTIPKSVALPENAWNNAINMRKEIGDLKSAGSYKENVDMSFANKAAALK
ncbi:ABC transporter substrate-binding protein [bacterium]|nr:ABC transporter substrate-binding protein [bacterium]